MKVVLLVVAVMAVGALAGALLWFGRADPVGDCLDSGGCWDAERGACEAHDQSRCAPLP